MLYVILGLSGEAEFICGLFNDAVINWDCIMSNDRLIDEWWFLKDMEEGYGGPI
jgi:hypothetical protein